MTQPKVTEWDDKKGFQVSYGGEQKAYSNSISYANLPALHAILTEKLAEMNSRKWVAGQRAWMRLDEWGVYQQGEKDDGFKAMFWGDDAEKEARAYADRKNAEEGLS